MLPGSKDVMYGHRSYITFSTLTFFCEFLYHIFKHSSLSGRMGPIVNTHGGNMRAYIYITSVVFALTLASCVEHDVDKPQDTIAWDLSSVEGIDPLPDANIGRLWVLPNPVVFGVNEAGYPVQDMMIDIGNIGSEEVVIEDVTISGDPDFDFLDPPEEGRYPHEIGGDLDCNGCGGIGFALAYAETTGKNAKSTMIVHTNDPTSPTVSVPIYLDETRVYIEPYFPHDNMRPLVKPNPIRIDKDEVHGEYQVEICLALHVGTNRRGRFLSLEAFGGSFTVEDVKDYYGNHVTLPVPYDQWTADPYSATLSYRPEIAKAEDGALIAHFEEENVVQKSIVIPIIVR